MFNQHLGCLRMKRSPRSLLIFRDLMFADVFEYFILPGDECFVFLLDVQALLCFGHPLQDSLRLFLDVGDRDFGEIFFGVAKAEPNLNIFGVYHWE